MDEAYVTKAEIEVERSPAELALWVRAKFDQIAELPGGKQAVRFRKGLCKTLGEEVYALSIWAGQRFSGEADVRLLPVVGNQTFDALVKDYGAVPPTAKHVEITQAHEGETVHLRTILLEQNGWAWPSAKLDKTGTKKTGIQVKVRRALTSAELTKKTIQLVGEAVLGKAGKPYPLGTELVVMFEDHISVREVIGEKLQQYCDDEVSTMQFPFERVYLVGWFKGIYVTYGDGIC